MSLGERMDEVDTGEKVLQKTSAWWGGGKMVGETPVATATYYATQAVRNAHYFLS